ncbi:MAG: glycosyltransferase family 1 protein [Alsobacter sp.]
MSKILIVSEALGEPNHRRGIFHFTRDLVRSLAPQGHELTLLVETSARYRRLRRRQKQVRLFAEGNRLIELLALYRFLDEVDMTKPAPRSALRRQLRWCRERLQRVLSLDFALAFLRATRLLPTRTVRIGNDPDQFAYVPPHLRHLSLFRDFLLEPGFYGFQDVSALLRLPPPVIDARGYDVVLLDTPVRVKLKRSVSTRVIGVVHDLLPLTDLKLSDEATRVFLSRLESSLAQVSELAFVSNHSLQLFRELLPHFARVPARVVHPRTSFASLPDLPSPQTGRPSFVVIVSAEPRKNLPTVVQAFRRLPQADLVVIGQTGIPQAQLDLPSNVRLAGYVDDDEKARLIATAHGLIMPSHAEGFGIPIIEALAAQTPVLCSDIPVFREVAGDLADYFDPFSPASLAASVERVIAGQDERRERIRDRHAELSSRFGLEKQADDLLAPRPATDVLARALQQQAAGRAISLSCRLQAQLDGTPT